MASLNKIGSAEIFSDDFEGAMVGDFTEPVGGTWAVSGAVDLVDAQTNNFPTLGKCVYLMPVA